MSPLFEDIYILQNIKKTQSHQVRTSPTSTQAEEPEVLTSRVSLYIHLFLPPSGRPAPALTNSLE